MSLGYRYTVVLTLVVCALSSQAVLAKKHHKKSHKPSAKTSTKSSSGTVSLNTNSYQGLGTLSAGTLLLTPTPYQGLIANPGIGTLVANPVGTLALVNLYQSIPTISYGASTVSNSGSLGSAGVIMVAYANPISSDSAGTLSVNLSSPPISGATLQINNAFTLSGSTSLVAYQPPPFSATFLADSNVVFPADAVIVSSGTLSPTVPEPTSLGLVAIAALAFLRRQSRK